MNKQEIRPSNEKEWLELRTKDITSTEISALFGISPYTTEFELWHRKKEGNVVDFEQTDRMLWGTRLQDAIASGIAQDNNWTIRRMDEYVRVPELRIGASFDFAIGDEGLLEIKNVDSLQYKQGWEIDGDNVEAPPHIEIQVQHQLAVSGRAFAYLGALIGGNRVVLIKREPDAEIIEAIKLQVSKFWASIDSNTPPLPNFEKDAEFISKLYRYAEPGKLLDLSGDEGFKEIAVRHKALGDLIKKSTEERDGLKAQMLMTIGDAEKVICEGFSISAGLVGPAEIAYTREGYRNFRLNWPRAKKEK